MFVLETSCAYPPLVLHDASVALGLSRLPGEFTAAEAAEVFCESGVPDELSAALVQELVTCRVFDDTTVTDRSSSGAADAWRQFGWAEAYSYLAATRDYPFVQMGNPAGFVADNERMQEYSQESAPPCVYQTLPAEQSFPLRKLDSKGSLSSAISSLSGQQIRGREGVAVLLDACFGERGKISFLHQGEFLRKAVPSGGARHPTEAFLFSFSGFCFPLGVYHYNVQHHRLDLLRSGDFYKTASEATFDLGKKYAKPPVALLVFTTLFERAMWRYRDARSWRAPLMDVGHTMMAYRVVSNALGFKHYTYQKFQDDTICGLLGVNPVRQLPLFVGTLVDNG